MGWEKVDDGVLSVTSNRNNSAGGEVREFGVVWRAFGGGEMKCVVFVEWLLSWRRKQGLLR